MGPLTLIIIEDEPAHFKLMKRAITSSIPEATVHHFIEANECLAKLDELSPDIIITDYLMPGMDGIGFLETLKQENRDIPVIVITGQGDENIAVQTMKLGAWDYLVKTSDFFTLIPSVIEKVVRERKLKDALHRFEKRFKDIAERISDWIWEVDQNGRYIYSNPMVLDILGYHPDEIIGKHFLDLFSIAGNRAFSPGIINGHCDSGLYPAFENCLIHKDGHEVIVETKGVPFYDKAGKILGYRGIHRDVSERKRAEEALRESEDKFRSIFSESPIGIEIFDSEGRLLDANQSCLNMFGIADLDDMKRLKLFSYPHVPENVRARLLQGETVTFETTYDFEKVKELDLYKTSGSGIISLDVLITRLGLKGKKSFSGYLVQLQDITHRKRTEEHIRYLSQQLMKAQEIERQRLSRDLHDHLAQDLSTLKIGLDTFFNDQPDAPAEKKARLSELSIMVQQTIMAVRDLAYGLHPAVLDQLGLMQAVRQLCEEFGQGSGLQVDFYSAGLDEAKLSFDTEISLYRIIQEGLNNIKKHADATRAVVRLVASYPDIILRIEDNGKGFDVKNRLEHALTLKRMGMRSMEERVALLNGKMQLESRPGQGTKIVIEVPFQEKTNG